MFKVNHKDTHSFVFFVNFEHISYLALVFLLLTLSKLMPTGYDLNSMITPFSCLCFNRIRKQCENNTRGVFRTLFDRDLNTPQKTRTKLQKPLRLSEKREKIKLTVVNWFKWFRFSFLIWGTTMKIRHSCFFCVIPAISSLSLYATLRFHTN